MTTKFSLFYQEQFEPGFFPVPLLALEHYAALTSQELPSDDDIFNALHQVLTSSCRRETPSDQDYIYLVQRFGEISQPQETEGQSTGKSFGTSFAAYLNDLEHIAMLGAMTNYNLPEMRRLYCEVDFQAAKSLMEAYARGLMEKNVIAYEAALYGAGNSYKNDSASGSKPVDANSKEGMAMLAQFGIGDVSSLQLDQLGITGLVTE